MRSRQLSRCCQGKMPLKALPHALSPRGQTEQGSATQRSLSASMQSSRRVTTHLGRALLDDRLGRCLLRRALLLHAVAASRQHRTIALRQRPRERTPKSANGAGHVQVAAKSVDACAGTLWHATMLAASWEGLITGVAFLDAGMMSSAVDPVAQRAKVATKQRSAHTHMHRNIVRSQAWTWARGAIACSRRGHRADRLAAE